MYSQENYYWWHVAKRKTILSLLQPYTEKKTDLLFADMGCGTGKLMEDLAKFGKVEGFDTSQKALAFCKKRGHQSLTKINISSTLPVKDNFFNIIIAADVLEHIQKEEGCISEFYRVLKGGGILVVTVPAYPFLFSYWDKMLGHQRRYTKNSLANKLVKAGFKIDKISYYNSFIFPVAIIFRTIKSLLSFSDGKPSSDFISLPAPINKILLVVSGIERDLLKRINLPFGLSIVCVAEKE